MPFEHDRTTATAATNATSDTSARRRVPESYAAGAEARRPKDSLLFIGMGDYAHDEAAHLNKIAPEGARSVRQRGKADAWRGQDLTTSAGIAAFVATLGGNASRQSALATVLEAAGDNARDEVAQLLEVYAEAESGSRKLERVVLSGHSVGDQIWGDINGEITFELLASISALFPTAVGQVEDLMLSACYTGGEAGMDQYKQIFPNVQSIWAYHDSSPGTWSGAMEHMTRWEQATRGKDSDPKKIKKDGAKGLRKGKNVSVWTGKNGYDGAQSKSLVEALTAVQDGSDVFNEYYQGTREVESSQSGPLRDFYNVVQAALAVPALDAESRETCEVYRDVTIRLLYYKVVREKFMHAHGKTIEAGYKQVGQPMPNYAVLSRGDAATAAGEFATMGGSGEAYRLLDEGLMQLSPSVIPSTWV
ncbi:MAG: hypothetical protein ACI9WU_001284 [Myxococcota bacterium]|jgi:hypothetical protein